MTRLEWMQALANTPLPIVIELDESEGWRAWDAAVRELDHPADQRAAALAEAT